MHRAGCSQGELSQSGDSWSAAAQGTDAGDSSRLRLSFRTRQFARLCVKEGLTFVGPPPEAIEAMGEKLAAIELAAQRVCRACRVRSHPDDAADAVTSCERIGYPLLIKATAGGGGRGMRVVRGRGPRRAFESAASEAQSAFGDSDALRREIHRARASRRDPDHR